MKPNIAQERTYQFALRIIQLAHWLRTKKEFDFSRQIFRSGTSIGANVEEAQAAISKADFISKISIASKEARETNYWLRLLSDSKTIPPNKINGLVKESKEIVNILTAIVKTGQQDN